MRLFIALPLPNEVEEVLGKTIFALRQKGGASRVKWVAPKNIHLTVKFLGEVEERNVPGIKESVQEIAGRYKIIESMIDSLGGFPNLSRPRVIWAGMTGGVEEISRMVMEMEKGMEEQGFPREGKGFKPHITLGRVKEAYGMDELLGYIKSFNFEPVSFRLGELVLFKSTLTPRGPIYDRLLTAKLTGGQERFE